MTREDQIWLNRFQQMIESNLEDPQFQIGTMVEHTQISKRQLHRKLKQLTDLTPNQYLQEAKLQKAKSLIEAGTYNRVKDVAYNCGFKHLGYFAHMYKARFGKLPSELIR